MLAATRFSGKQVRLAEALEIQHKWLSQYMTGKNTKGASLDSVQLNDRLSTITHALRRANLPAETPTAEEIAAAARQG
eukprot:5509388-Prymnesium_polylepis.1